ncbi:uncharacterized protein LOC124677745 isoform X2 [Lolium rigidum]|uniref:uncharacterized protein LOC124677745 isoform X2 n=1 Tax=Lolium rigidum TaxID=89674 RepID=UPI001F5E2293|nr:uncharacterized protein LOC124677745 isoform X2 [Lolium rigidum]
MSRSVNTFDKICFWCGQSGHVRACCPELIREGYGHRQNWYNREPGYGFSMRDCVAKSWQRSGDWLCPETSCGNVNFAFRGACNRCGTVRPSSVSGVCAGRGSQKVTVRMTVDDLEKWYQFKNWYQVKGTEHGDKKMCEVAAVCAKHCSNISTHVWSDRKGAPWLIDSGASRHMAGSYGEFHDYIPEIGTWDWKKTRDGKLT